jgi:hypothetical protein
MGTVVRHGRERPGEPIHVDIKGQGRITQGGAWRVHGRRCVRTRTEALATTTVHAAVHDRSRVACAEILTDERKRLPLAFMNRAIGFFADRGITVERVLTDNGVPFSDHTSSPAHRPRPASITAGTRLYLPPTTTRCIEDRLLL